MNDEIIMTEEEMEAMANKLLAEADNDPQEMVVPEKPKKKSSRKKTCRHIEKEPEPVFFRAVRPPRDIRHDQCRHHGDDGEKYARKRCPDPFFLQIKSGKSRQRAAHCPEKALGKSIAPRQILSAVCLQVFSPSLFFHVNISTQKHNPAHTEMRSCAHRSHPGHAVPGM